MREHAAGRLQWLLSQIAAGWQLEAPAIERSTRRASGQTSTFEFVLHNERGCQAVAIHDCPEVRSFLQERGIASVTL